MKNSETMYEENSGDLSIDEVAEDVISIYTEILKLKRQIETIGERLDLLEKMGELEGMMNDE